MGEGSIVSPRAIGRRGTIGGLGAATIATVIAPPRRALAGIPPGRALAFEVLRNGNPIGTHRVTFAPAGDRLEVSVAIDIVVRWAGLVLYRYNVAGTETWRAGTLVSASAETSDDGTRHAMRATRSDGALTVEGTHGPTYRAPAKSIVSSHWNPAQLDAPMISIQDGELLTFRVDPRGPSTITAHGRELVADHYTLEGKSSLELWYDRQRVWSKLRTVSWEGSRIEYRQA
jgi:hypothetical protein